MQGVTLTVALICSTLVLLLRPPYALAAYIAALVWYPYYLVVSIGTIDISVGRIVVFVLLLRCVCDDGIRKNFVWSRLDTWVALSMAVYVVMYCITRPLSTAIENRAGFIMDTWFAYIVVRFIVTDKETLTSFMKVTAVVLTALAILGVVESVTHSQPFLGLKRFRPWDKPWGAPVGDTAHLRWGLARAIGPFGHSIMFGSCFLMFLPMIWALRHQRGYWGKLAYPLSGIAAIGALSSMSSGPWVAEIVLFFCLLMERFKRWVKPAIICFVLLCIFIEIYSNRPFYRVLISYANPVGGDARQRSKLIDLAIENFGEWWLAGYGDKDPGWGERYFYASYTDVTNEFIRAGVDYGLLGLLAFCAVLVAAFCGLSHVSKQTTDRELQSFCWSLGSSVVCLIVVWLSVSFYGQAWPLFYSILGIIGSSVHFARSSKFNGPSTAAGAIVSFPLSK